MALPDIKDSGAVASFQRWGWPYHGLVKAGQIVAGVSAGHAVGQPAGGDVIAVRVPGNGTLSLTPAEVSADTANGLSFADYALLSGSTRRVYDTPLGDINTWIWAVSVNEKWLVHFDNGFTVTVTSSGLNYSITLHLTEFGKIVTDASPTPITHTIVLSGTLSGTWNDEGILETKAPFDTEVNVADVSSDGKRAALEVKMPYLGSRQGAVGFLLLTLDSISSATVSTIADWSACNPAGWVIDTSDYGPPWGVQADGLHIDPWTNWVWFDHADVLQQVKLHFVYHHPYNTYNTDFTLSIEVGGTALSTFVIVETDSTIPATSTVLDGDGDGGRIKASQSYPDSPTWEGSLSHTYPYERVRRWVGTLQDYFAGQPLLSGEDPNVAQYTLDLVNYSNKAIGFVLSVYHWIPGAPGTAFIGEPPHYIISDKYYGNVVHADGADSGVVHAPIEPATCVGSISGSVLTVTGVSAGRLSIGAGLSGSGIAAGTVITGFISGTGGVGTYSVSPSQTAASTTITASYADKPNTSYHPVTGDLSRNFVDPICYV